MNEPLSHAEMQLEACAGDERTYQHRRSLAVTPAPTVTVSIEATDAQVKALLRAIAGDRLDTGQQCELLALAMAIRTQMSARRTQVPG